MVLCKFYANGYCKFGDSCRFEHERQGGQSSGRRDEGFGQNDRNYQFQQPLLPQPFSFNKTAQAVMNSGGFGGGSSGPFGSSPPRFSFNQALAAVQSQPQQRSFFASQTVSQRPSFFANSQPAQQMPAPSLPVLQPQAPSSGFSFNRLLSQVQSQNIVPQSYPQAPPPAASSSFFGGSNIQNNPNFPSQPNPSFFPQPSAPLSSSGPQRSSFFNTQPQQSGSSFFGNNAASTVSATSTPVSARTNRSQPLPSNPKLYTPLDQLTQEERKAFEADSFQEGLVPLVPPPRELVDAC